MIRKRLIPIGLFQLFCLLVVHAAAFSMALSDRLKEVPLYPDSKITQVIDDRHEGEFRYYRQGPSFF